MVKNSLLLIQTTESDNHRDTQFRHIEMILNCARKKNPKVQLLLVYLTISEIQFTLPTRSSLKEEVKIYTGNIDPDDFISYFWNRSKTTSLA